MGKTKRAKPAEVAATTLFTEPEPPPAPKPTPASVGPTPGPWKATSERWPRVHDENTWWRIYQDTGEDGELVADISRTADPSPEEIARDAANARLIAAAPCLLAACKLAVIRVKDEWAKQCEGEDLWPLVEALRAAIDRAERDT